MEVLGLGDPAAAPESAERVFTRPRSGLGARLRAGARLPWQATGSVLLVLDPDLVVPAMTRRRLGGPPVAVDVHEDYTKLVLDRDWPSAQVKAVTSGLRWANELTARADLTIVADDQVPPLRARNRVVVRNTPESGYLPEPADPAARPRALYVGDIRRTRGAFDMVRAIAQAPDWTMDLVGPIAPSEADELRAQIAAERLGDRVRLWGRQPPERAWAGAADAWVGLSLLHSTPAFVEALPTKVVEYLTAGLPVLASPLPRQESLLVDSGAGIVVDAAAAGEVLRRWQLDPSELLGLRDRARDWAATRTDTGEYRRLAAAVAALLA